MSLDLLFAPGGPESLALLLVRVTALMTTAPLFSARQLPMAFRAVLTVLMTGLAWAPGRSASPGVLAVTPTAVVGEVLAGMVLGLGAAVVVAAAELAGEYVGTTTGLAGAASIDPVTFQQAPTISTFLRLTALALLLTFDLHLVLVDALVASVRAAPLGGTLALSDGARELARAAGPVFAAGIRLAAPVMVAMLVLNAALGVLARAAPQLQVMSVAFGLQTGVGLVVLGATLPFLAAALSGWTSEYDAWVGQIFRALRAPGA